MGLKECWEVELRKLMSDLPKVVFAHCQWFTWCSISAFTFFVVWLGGLVKKKPLAHHEKKKSNHWTPSKLGIYPSPLSHLSVQKVWCSELLPTQCSFIAESTQIQCWSDGLRQNCYVQLHSDDLTLIGMRGDTSISLFFLIWILSAEFLSKLFKLLRGEIGLFWHPDQFIKVAPRWC